MPDPVLSAALADSDGELLRRVRGGDEAAATRLFTRYAPWLRGRVRARASTNLASRVDADDIVQSAFQTFFRQIRRGAYEAGPGQTVQPLLDAIARSTIRDQEAFHRAARRDVRQTYPLNEGLAHAPSGARAARDSGLQRVLCQEALDALAPHLREMVELRLAGHAVEEIVDRTGHSRRTVERNLSEVRKLLRALLEKD